MYSIYAFTETLLVLDENILSLLDKTKKESLHVVQTFKEVFRSFNRILKQFGGS